MAYRLAWHGFSLVAPAATISLDELGAAGDGQGDDWSILQSAIVAAGAYDGQSTIMMSASATYRTTRPLVVAGRGITFAGGGSIASEGRHAFTTPEGFSATTVDIEPASQGDTTITTTHASGLAAGDWVMIQTGQTSAFNRPPIGAPDAELNRVSSVRDNVVELERPLAKDYRQEFFDPGKGVGSGVTSTSRTGDPATICVRRVAPVSDVRFDGIAIDHRGNGSAIAGDLWVDLLVDGVTATTTTNFLSSSPWTGTVRRSSVHVIDGWWVAAGFGARDIIIEDCRFTADRLGYLHIHEGASDVTVRRCSFSGAAGVDMGDRPVIGVRGRGYRIELADITIENSSTGLGGAGVRIDVGVTGSAERVTFTGTGRRIVNNATTTFNDAG